MDTQQSVITGRKVSLAVIKVSRNMSTRNVCIHVMNQELSLVPTGRLHCLTGTAGYLTQVPNL